jgi:hypothetical protein
MSASTFRSDLSWLQATNCKVQPTNNTPSMHLAINVVASSADSQCLGCEQLTINVLNDFIPNTTKERKLLFV